MSTLSQAWESIPVEGALTLITADRVRELSGREPRLMMKFDHSSQLPAKLKNHGAFILPLKNGLYAILKGAGYHRPEPCPPALDFPRQTVFALGTTQTGLSEMQHLDEAYNSGLLSHFLGEPILYPTIRGRKRSPQFTLRFAEHLLEVAGVQVEIDGGFEGRNTVTVVEAKIGECEDFHLRQLYYPFRFWSTQTSKRIRPVFFTYDPTDGLYRLREYRFDPADVYGPPGLVKAAAYRLVEPTGPLTRALPVKRSGPIPQADRLDKVALIPFLVNEGFKTPETVAPLLEFSPRQGRYYLDAAGSLGLLERSYELSELGQEYLTCSPGIRHQLLARAVLGLPLAHEALVGLLLSDKAQMTKSDFLELARRSTVGLSPSTATRRAQTLWSWLAWAASHSPVLAVEGDRLALTQPSSKLSGEWKQLSLFGDR